MPSATILAQKQQTVAELTEKLKEAKAGVIVNYQGITVDADTKLRSELRKAGVEYKVFKNSVITRAMEGAGYPLEPGSLNGMSAIAFSSTDEVAPAKILKGYADKIETFELKTGFIDGAVIDAKAVSELADTPNKETLVCKIMGCMKSPVYGLAYVLQAIIDKQEAPATQAAE